MTVSSDKDESIAIDNDSTKLFLQSMNVWHSLFKSAFHIEVVRERSGSVVECLTQDREVAGSSLTGITGL